MEFFRDKSKLFECDIKVSGTEFNMIRPRLIFKLDGSPFNLVVEGKVTTDGKCQIETPAFKNMPSIKGGNVTLEVIAENMLFESWHSDFELQNSMNVVVENVTTESKKYPLTETKKVEVIVKEEFNTRTNKYLKENIDKKSHALINEALKKYTGMTEDQKLYVKSILKEFKPKRETLEWSKRRFSDKTKTTLIKLFEYYYEKKQFPISKQKLKEEAKNITKKFFNSKK